MAKMRTAGKIATAIAAGAVLSAIGLSAPASATPTGCGVNRDNSRNGWAICTGGSGQVRVKIACYDAFHDITAYYYGPWVGINKKSSKTCENEVGTTDYPGGVSYQTK
jgi:hypothetical protein